MHKFPSLFYYAFKHINTTKILNKYKTVSKEVNSIHLKRSIMIIHTVCLIRYLFFPLNSVSRWQKVDYQQIVNCIEIKWKTFPLILRTKCLKSICVSILRRNCDKKTITRTVRFSKLLLQVQQMCRHIYNLRK
jgi:hypothetical protein